MGLFVHLLNCILLYIFWTQNLVVNICFSNLASLFFVLMGSFKRHFHLFDEDQFINFLLYVSQQYFTVSVQIPLDLFQVFYTFVTAEQHSPCSKGAGPCP